MKITKKDIAKLKIFSEKLKEYQESREEKSGYFYNADNYQIEIIDRILLADEYNKKQEAFDELDEDDQQKIKDCLSSRELRYKANPTSKIIYHYFNYVKKIK